MGTRESTLNNSSWPTLADIESCLCDVYGEVQNDEPAPTLYQTTSLDANTSFDDSLPVNCLFWDAKNVTSFSSSLVAASTACATASGSANLNRSSITSAPNIVEPPRTYASIVEDVLYQRVAVAICCFGLFGNAVNIAVLAAAGRRQSLGGTTSTRMQRFARLGLIALAVADSSFCIAVIPYAFVERVPFGHHVEFSLLYAVYSDAFINWFAMSGTWLTVAMAVGRYAAVCHPFRARVTIGRTVALRSILTVFVACLVANVPRFLSHSVESINCHMLIDTGNGTVVNHTVEYYFRWYGPMHARQNARLELAYVWVYFVVAVAAPLVVLIFTGCRLGMRLRRSRRDAVERDTLGGVSTAATEAIDRPFTVTLVAVAAMHVVLVSPAELLNFARQRLLFDAETDSGDGAMIMPGAADESYNLLATMLNTLQAANYSLNFLLYCLVNVAFRRRFVELVGCRLSNGFGGPLTAENRVRLHMLANSGALVNLSQRRQHRALRRSASDWGYSSCSADPAATRVIGYSIPVVVAADPESCFARGSLS